MNDPLVLREHVLAAHKHGSDEAFVWSVEADFLALWHEWEHNPRWPNAKHAHDEFTARQRGVPCA